MDIIENLKKEKTKWENKIYGVGETRIDLMIEDVIRELQKYQNELEKKDKIIDLLIDGLMANDEHFNYCEKKRHKKLKGNCKDCIKEYFTKKVEGK